jgi:hypothetical protein
MIPGIVSEYTGAKRECRVEIPGITDGAEELPVAEIAYPIGDGDDTEIEIKPGDKVWLSFHGGDPRYPIIMAYRTKRAGASVGTRRFHHSIIELEADAMMTMKVGPSTITITPLGIDIAIGAIKVSLAANGVTVNGKLSVTGVFVATLGSALVRLMGGKFEVTAQNTAITSSGAITISGPTDISNLKVNGAPYLAHTHNAPGGGGETTGVNP